MGYDRAPAWVKEGIAGYYESVEFKKGKLYVGYLDPQRRIPLWLPVESLLTLDHGTLSSLGDPKVNQAFYLQSHLLVHMLRHTPGYNPAIPQLFNALKRGMDSREAFRRFYGVSSDRLNRELLEYCRRGRYRMVEVYEGIQVPVSVAVADGTGRRVTVKEKKCTWCKVGNVLRRVPIIIPVP